MKKAKIILTSLAILAIAGGVLAFKANRQPRNVYTLLAGSKIASTLRSGIIYTTTVPNCTLTSIATTSTGDVVNVSSTTTNAASVTLFRSGTSVFVTTFAYCTLWMTKVELAND